MDFIRVLVVDDSELKRKQYQEILRNVPMLNYEVTVLPSQQFDALEDISVYNCLIISHDLIERPVLKTLLLRKSNATKAPAIICLIPDDKSKKNIMRMYKTHDNFDYILTSKCTDESLIQTLLYAIEKNNLRKKIALQKRKLTKLSHFDPVTLLPNRKYFEQQVKKLVNAKKTNSNISLLIMDIDNFKFVNDNFGHSQGNFLLKAIADRITSNIRHSDLLTYLGGDEFGIILVDYTRPQVITFADRIIHLLHTPFFIKSTKIYITMSIGISSFPEDGKSSDDLIKRADIALYQSKALHGNSYQFFSNDMSETIQDKLTTKNALCEAIETHKFFLNYQPKYNLVTSKVHGFEVFIRWQREDNTVIPPNKFISIAEEFGLIIPIGYWIIEQVCRDCGFWVSHGIKQRIAINLSARQLCDPQFITKLSEIINRYNIAPELLEFELTESVLMSNPKVGISTMNELKNMGFALTIDDFGKGFSSLNYLKYLPIDAIKIDQSFIREVCIDEQDHAIVAAVVALSKHLNLEVIAEGIETQEQLDTLLKIGCTQGQGYYLCKPDRKEEILKKITTEKL